MKILTQLLPGTTLGIVYNKLEKYQEALQAYDYAITIDESFASAYFNTGNTYMNMGEYTKALDSFRKTVGDRRSKS